jgi:hypothetical protein
MDIRRTLRRYIRTSLCLRQSLLPGNGILRPETGAQLWPPKANGRFAETERVPYQPPIPDISPAAGKSLQMGDCLVADAAMVEPVSAAQFPANREINREFRRKRPLRALLKRTRERIQSLTVKFSTQQSRELFRRSREFWRKDREFYRPNPKSSPDEIFGTYSPAPE